MKTIGILMIRLSTAKATYVAFLLFLVTLGVVSMMDSWWPGTILVVGVPLIVRQFLVGRYRDALVSLIVFAGSYTTIVYDINWELFLPALFILGAFYIFFNELTAYTEETEKEREEDFLSDQESEYTGKRKRISRKKSKSFQRRTARRR